jgi:O-antigen/teichoic acid export membrane protein
MSRTPAQLLRDFFTLSGGELLAKIAGFVAFAYLARVLQVESYGAVELAVAVTMVFALVVDFGFAPIGARELARSNGGDPRRLAAVITTLRLGLAAASIAFIWLGSLLADAEPATRALVRVFSLSLIGAPFVLNWMFQGLGRLGWVAGAQLVRNLVFAGLVLLLVHSSEDLLRVGWIEVASLVAMASWYVAGYLRVVGRPALGAPLAELQHMAAEALPVGMSRTLWVLYQYVPTLLVASLVGGAAMAWFGAAHRLVTSLGTFVHLYHFNLYPQFVIALSQGHEALRRALVPSFRVAAWAGVAGAFAVTQLAGNICALLFGEPYVASGPVLAVLIWALPISFLGSHARFLLIGAGHQRAELLANGAGAALALLLGLALVPSLGAIGGGLAMVGGALATWVTAHLLATRRIGAIPSFGPAVRPLLLAGVLGFAAAYAPGAGTWLGGLTVSARCFGLAPLVERALWHDTRALLQGRQA